MLGRGHRRNWWLILVLLTAAVVGVLLVARAYHSTVIRVRPISVLAVADVFTLALLETDNVGGVDLL